MRLGKGLLGKTGFVSVNIFSSAIVLSRSVLFLKYLSDRDLGILILLQAIIGMFGLLQIGLFNGGLRVFSIDSYREQYNKVNDNIVSFIVIVTVIVIVGMIGYYYFRSANILIVIIASIFGGVSLLRNWFSNLLIARKRYKNINIITFWASLISAFLSLLIFEIGIYGAIISIGALPLIYIFLFLSTNKDFRPKSFGINYSTIKTLLIFGFVPYLSGIALILYNQIDKFIIAKILSVEQLGQFYLATVFMTVFTLIPNNINSLLAPNAINSYKQGNLKDTYKTFYIYLGILSLYSFIAFILLKIFGNIVVGYIFPDKLSQLHYLFILLPGFMATTISRSFGFMLYVALHFKAILWNNIFSLVSYLVILFILIKANIFTLDNVSYAKSLQGILVFLFLFLVMLLSLKKINKFYYLNKVERKIRL